MTSDTQPKPSGKEVKPSLLGDLIAFTDANGKTSFVRLRAMIIQDGILRAQQMIRGTLVNRSFKLSEIIPNQPAIESLEGYIAPKSINGIERVEKERDELLQSLQNLLVVTGRIKDGPPRRSTLDALNRAEVNAVIAITNANKRKSKLTCKP